MYIGVGVGWQRRCQTCQSLLEPGNQGTFFFSSFVGGHYDGYRVRSYCARWRTLTPHKGNDRITWCEYGKATTRQLHSNTRCCLCSGHTRKQSISLALSSIGKRASTKGAEVRLTSSSWKDAVHPSCDSPNTSRRFSLGASNVCLVGDNPTCSISDMVGVRGSMVIRLQP